MRSTAAGDGPCASLSATLHKDRLRGRRCRRQRDAIDKDKVDGTALPIRACVAIAVKMGRQTHWPESRSSAPSRSADRRSVLVESLAAVSEAASREREPRVQLLLADDDAMLRSLVAARVRSTVTALAVLEAKDGAEAIQLGLQQRPQIALIDVNMPRVGGIEAAITLRDLQPQMCLALQTGEPAAHRERARVPICQAKGTWIHRSWRPFSRGIESEI
jgi:CheY-like chemotaxis protein